MKKWQELDEQREKLAAKREALENKLRYHFVDTQSETYIILKSNYAAITPVRLSESGLIATQKQFAFINYEYWRVTAEMFDARFGEVYEWVKVEYEKASKSHRDSVLGNAA